MREGAPEGLVPPLQHARGAFHAPDGDLAQAGEGDELRPDLLAEVAVRADRDLAQGEAPDDGEEGEQRFVGGGAVVHPCDGVQI